MNYSEFKSAATKIVTLETAIAEGYRALQAQLKAFQEAKIVTLQVKLNVSFEVLKTEAQRLIDGYRPIAETQDTTPTATVEQKINKVVASLPTGTIANNSDFSVRINTGTADEKIWLVKKDGNGAGVTFVKTECGRYYESYAGDAIRSIAVLGMPTFVEAGVLRTLVAVPDAVRLQEDAQKLGLTLHLYDRTSDTETPQDATATKTSTATEVEIDQTDLALFRLGTDSRENFYKQFQALKSILLAEGVKVGRLIGEKSRQGGSMYWELTNALNSSDKAGLMLSSNGLWVIVKSTPEQVGGLAAYSLYQMAFRQQLDFSIHGGFRFAH